jgi:Zn2+/Cd2+-exporting ATPase
MTRPESSTFTTQNNIHRQEENLRSVAATTTTTGKVSMMTPIQAAAPPTTMVTSFLLTPSRPPRPLSGLESSSAGTGTFHPNFMFCGACTECHEADTAAGSTADDTTIERTQHKDNINGNNGNNDNKNIDQVILSNSMRTTTFGLQQPLTNASPSQALVIQSVLQSMPGIHKVTLSKVQKLHCLPSIQVTHDESVMVEGMIQTLKAAGHHVLVTASQLNPSDNNNNNNNNTVRSAFYVQGICCASEIPPVRKIVKSLSGVSKLNVNLTTKVVHVQHDISYIQANEIASALSAQGFPTQIQRDGKYMAQAKKQQQALALSGCDSRNGRTTLHVQGILQEQDVERIHNTLSVLEGVSKVGVNVQEGVISIDHDVDKLSSDYCANYITHQSPRFSCNVAIPAERAVGDAAAAALDSIGRSRYVESTFHFEGMQPYHVPTIEAAISKNFIPAQVRATYTNVPSETVKVEHDPKLVSADDLCRLFQTFNGEIPLPKINMDGADANLYLPLQEDYPENQQQQQLKLEKDPSLLKIHANVWLSGIFWLLSMFSFIDGKNWFKFFGLASVLFGLPPIAFKAWRTIRRWQFDANCMMVTAALGALALQEFDEAASVAFLFAVSEFLEARASLKARRALAEICALRPDHANVIHPITKEIVVIPADRVPLGSLVSVRTGDKIAADGVVVEGKSSIDESSLTGESRPVSKGIGDSVSGGTINIGQTQLVIKTTTTVEDSAVSRLIRLVEEAQSNRSPTEMTIDAFARSYTPSVMVLATLMCTIPWAFGVDIGRHWTLNGLIIIVIACPCALTISTPVTYAAGLAATAQRGIIIKGGSKLEAMGSVDRIVFDKTGTLTKGSFSVTHLLATSDSKSRQEMLQLLALMQQRSSHPLSSCLVQAAKQEGVDVPSHLSVSDHQLLKGEGITATINSTSQVYVGNQRLFHRLGMMESLSGDNKSHVTEWGKTGGTIGFIGSKEDGIIGMFCLQDEIREDAKSVIEELKGSGIDVLICTGDSDAAAQAVAKEIGIPSSLVNSQLLPEDKLHLVGSLKRPPSRSSCGICCHGLSHRYVLFVGDGVNDAPALAVADIGVSMGQGAAMALEMSDVTLMDSRLDKLTYSIHMGRRVLRTVKENIMISLVAKLVVVALTFAGKMTLLYAIASDVGVMLLVTLNGMKLLPSKSLFEITQLNRRKRRVAREHFELVGGGGRNDDDAMEGTVDIV